jgi:hypothetical protein
MIAIYRLSRNIVPCRSATRQRAPASTGRLGVLRREILALGLGTATEPDLDLWTDAVLSARTLDEALATGRPASREPLTPGGPCTGARAAVSADQPRPLAAANPLR